MAIEIGDYLFPSALAVTAKAPAKVLVLGACMAEQLVWKLSSHRPDTQFELTLFNNVAHLPEMTAAEALSYDLVYVSLPLRDVLTDQVVDFGRFCRDDEAARLAEDAIARLEQIFNSLLQYKKQHGLLTIFANFLVPQSSVANSLIESHGSRDLSTIVRRLNAHLSDLIRRESNVYLADIDAIANSLGKASFLDDMIYFYAHAGYFSEVFLDHDMLPALNPAGPRLEPMPKLEEIYDFKVEPYFRAVWRQAEAIYRTVHQVDMVKLVIFDLDDTLWRGQIAEHYGDEGGWPTAVGWPIGIWEAIQHLRSRGVLVGVCSKNEDSVVRDRWARCVSLPWLKLDDFAFVEIGWRPKAESIAQMIQAASLTPKSVLFIDDNPVERAAVQEALPDIRTLGADPYVIRRVLLWAPEMQVAKVSNETAQRETMMVRQQLREGARAALSRADFLDSLQCRVQVCEVTSPSDARFSRAIELLNKTNQFNTTGERFSFREMVAFFAGGGKLHVFHVEDRFVQYGLVGVIRFKKNVFEQFAMSCRVMGLDIEASVIGFVIAQETGRCFEAHVKETPSNKVSRDLYSRAGFTRRDQDGVYVIERAATCPIARHLTISRLQEREAREAVTVQA